MFLREYLTSLINFSRSFEVKLFYTCQYVMDTFDGTVLGEKMLSVSNR